MSSDGQEELHQHINEAIDFDTALQKFYESLAELRLGLSSIVAIVSQQNERGNQQLPPDFQEFVNTVPLQTAPLLSEVHDNLHRLRDSVIHGESELSELMLICNDCISKGITEARQCLRVSTLCICDQPEDDGDGDDEHNNIVESNADGIIGDYSGPLPDGPEAQPAIASMVEMAIWMHLLANDMSGMEAITKEIIPLYTHFQRQTLRSRAKPSVANLVTIRRTAAKFNPSDNEEEEDMKAKQPHVHAVTCILSEASLLIQPLRGWYEALSSQKHNTSENIIKKYLVEVIKCASIGVDQEAQDLSNTVGGWFSVDRDLKEWVNISMGYMSQNPQQLGQQQQLIDVTGLDVVLEELAFLCQVSARYCQFIDSTLEFMSASSTSSSDRPLWLLLQEHSGQYATLEDCLSKSSLDRAIDIAAPVEIMDGVFVPSVVEDAFFVSRRAVERASSTFNSQALITLANRIAEAWGIEGGIYKALIDDAGSDHRSKNVQTLQETQVNQAQSKSAAEKDDFTAAFLDAIDDDIGDVQGQRHNMQGHHREDKNPSRLGLRERILLNSLCSLNGIASASSASNALSGLFNSIIEGRSHGTSEEEPTKRAEITILEFARDELKAHSKAYDILLREKSSQAVERWCGQLSNDDDQKRNWLDDSGQNLCIPIVQRYIRDNVYVLDAHGCNELEKDETLNANLIDPLKHSDLVREVLSGRCEPRVSLELAKVITSEITTIFFAEIVEREKPFSDWGALVLSKQIRVLETFLCSLLVKDSDDADHVDDGTNVISTAPIISSFGKMTQVCAVLQLEKPSDW
eukprot:CAMPEP_0116006900 /NCGR_PEP_ID=MMETSP0321-20121206/1993_1 /TAXON_ID=163516 /ORGANISM="Leptocylindrus danicus var. danicus, Strain B650" /LENGTH=803 /DNA_ID=CAMNT_0003475521 /DNA_START=125 /DNA_END=2533 /DNA_ORIENTATION=-